MIGRVWHGWTTRANADAYERLLKTEIFPGIIAKGVQGFEKIELFRRDQGAEIEFMTVMWFQDVAAVKAFAGEDYEAAYVPAKARALLARFDERSQHYDIRERSSPLPLAGEGFRGYRVSRSATSSCRRQRWRSWMPSCSRCATVSRR